MIVLNVAACMIGGVVSIPIIWHCYSSENLTPTVFYHHLGHLSREFDKIMQNSKQMGFYEHISGQIPVLSAGFVGGCVVGAVIVNGISYLVTAGAINNDNDEDLFSF